MRLICAMCAISLASMSGCYLSHLRDGEPADGGRDASTVRDAGAPDLGTIVPTSCSEFWSGLPWCPADPASAIGQTCDLEGRECRFECCQPGPSVRCVGGIWRASPYAPDCRGVRCAPPAPCGLGSCSYDRVCLRLEGLRGGDSMGTARCVEPPAPIDTCEAAPPGSIVDDPRTCALCTCAMIDAFRPAVQISLDCPCCDVAAGAP